MADPGTPLAHAAMRLVGAPFRLHGRDPRYGVDCVGVVIAALRGIGRAAPDTLHYRLRRTQYEDGLQLVRQLGLGEGRGPLQPGDVLLVRPGPAQMHAAIVGFGGIVHAHAGLGCVVLSPEPLPWPIEHHWRLLTS